MKQPVRPIEDDEFRKRYPIDRKLLGWRFRSEETSPCAFLVEGSDRFGRIVNRRGDDPGELLDGCVQDARGVQRQLKSFADNEEFYASVTLLTFDLRAIGFDRLADGIDDAVRAGATAGEIFGALRQVLLSAQGTPATADPSVAQRVGLFIALIDDALGGRGYA